MTFSIICYERRSTFALLGAFSLSADALLPDDVRGKGQDYKTTVAEVGPGESPWREKINIVRYNCLPREKSADKNPRSSSRAKQYK
jgi:hypothetical protein